MRFQRSVASSAALVLFLLPVPSASQVAEMDVPPGVRVSIALAWGEVRVVGDDLSNLRVVRSTQPSTDETTILEGSGAPLSMSMVDGEIRVEQETVGEGEFASSFIEVRLPRGTPVAVTMSRGGEIIVSGTRGEVEVENLNGSVLLEDVGGPIRVSARNGAITGELVGLLEPGASFASLNGEIDLSLPEDAAVTARLRTDDGRLRSEFPGEIRSRDTSLGEGAEVLFDINGGGTPLVATTRSGDIFLRRGPRGEGQSYR